MHSTPLNEKRQKLLHLMRGAETAGRPDTTSIPRRQSDSAVPLSFSQERLWFLNQLAIGSQFYVESSAVRLQTEMRSDALERAINAVVSRHEVLRARFELLDGHPVQSAMSRLHVPLATIDVSELSASDRQREIERIALEHATRSFDLSDPPLLRTSLLKLGPADYVFLLAIHHIVSDGWSMSIFSREVSEYYRVFSTGRTVDLAPLPIQYFDFAAWQRTNGTGEWLETQLAYWREHLRNLPPLDLRLDLSRPEVLSYAGSHLDVRLPGHLSAGLRALARREHATMFMTSLAVFGIVLNVHTGQVDLAVGTPTAGRNRAELEGLIGIFLNTLVLRLDLSGDPTFRGLLRRVKQEALAAFDRQDVPFEQLVNELHPDRDLSRNPLFQVLFQFFTPPGEKTGTASAQPDTIAVDRGTSILDLAWHLWDTADGVRGRIEYSTELFERGTVERYFQHFVRVLSEVISHPDRPISELNALTPEEQRTLLNRWQGVSRATSGRSIHELFAERVARSQDAVALIERDRRISYLELQHRADAFANRLREVGCRSGDRVAICLDRSVEMVAAAIAALQIGAAYVPLDPAYPLARLEFIFRDSGARALVSDRTHAARLQVDDRSVIGVDAAQSTAPDPVTESPRIRTGPLDAAYVIYTSGSTGRPKGVVGLHGSTLNRFEWMWNEFPFEPGEIACQRTAISFVDSVWETFGPLLAGVPLVIVPDAATRDTRELVDLLAEHRVSRLLVVPSLLQAVLETGIDLRSALHRLRLWFASGERLPVETARRFRSALPDARLVNLYGSSEVAGDILCELLDGPGADDLVPIGRPILNSRAYIVDRMLRLVPPGIAGELYVAGANLARGYLHQPALTAERFLPDPFSPEPGSRMYATGDRARHLPDGRIEFLGRTDHQIKIRGFRIEPEEVEAAIREHRAVRDVAVTAEDDGAGGRLTVWVVAHREPVSAEELLQVAARTLPGHMIPRAVVWLESLPLTPNGKLDRAALLKMERLSTAAEYVQPRSEPEQAVATLWAEVLGVSRIGVHDNFFDLGGHSLLAVRLVSRLRQDFGIELPLRDVFLHPTVAAFAAVVEAKLIEELESLSEDDARRQLHASGNQPC